MVKPYVEVREEVKDHFLRKKSEEKAIELVEKVRAEINALEEISFLKVAALAAKKGLHVAETKPFGESEYMFKLEHEFGFCAQAQRMFDRKDEISELSTGKFEEPQTCDKGVFTYRLSKYLSGRTSPLPEVRDKVVESYTNKRAGELAKEEAQRILKEAREAGQFTTKLLQKEKLVRISTTFFKKVADGGKIEVLQEAKNPDVPVINAAYQIATLNEFAEEPVEAPKADTPLYFLVQYKGRKDPAPREFVNEWAGLLKDQKSEILQSLYEDWKKNLMERADIKKAEKAEKKPDEKAEGEEVEEKSEEAAEKETEGVEKKDTEEDGEPEGESEKQPAEDKKADAEDKPASESGKLQEKEPDKKTVEKEDKPAEKPEVNPGD
jgi:hypothetical protein